MSLEITCNTLINLLKAISFPAITDNSDLCIVLNQLLLHTSKSADDREYIGSKTPIIKTLIDCIVKDDIDNDNTNEQAIQVYLLSIRLLRNLCALSPNNQTQIVTQELLNWCDRNLCAINRHSLQTAISQLLINSIASNTNTQSILWQSYINKFNGYIDILKEQEKRSQKETILPLVLMLIFNCLIKSGTRRKELAENTVLLKQIIQLINDYGDHESEHHNNVFHWIFLIYQSLIKDGYLTTIMNTLGDENYFNTNVKKKDIRSHPMFKDVFGDDVDNNNSSEPVGKATITEINQDEDLEGGESIQEEEKANAAGRTNPNQVLLYNLLDSMVDKDHNISDYVENDSVIDLKCCLFLLDELSVLYNLDFKRKAQAATAHLDTVLNENDFKSIYFIIKIFANITNYSDDMLDWLEHHNKNNSNNNNSVEDLNTVLGNRGLIALCIGTLHGNTINMVNNELDKEQQNNNNNNNNNNNSSKGGFKKEIIRILGNLAYMNKRNQDEIREMGGIQLILNHTNFDPSNPYIKEWSVFAIRNLMENNPENQKIISDLRLKGVANQEEILELGLKIELGEEGSVKFETTPELKEKLRLSQNPPPQPGNDKKDDQDGDI